MDLRIVFVGHVDHGKSTLIGRLLHDTNSVPKNLVDDVKKKCIRLGKEFEFAFLLDALEEEQEQTVTIDTTQIFFKSRKRNCVIIDAPGHKDFLKNMVTGATSADTAILIIDALEGVKEQTKRHAYILSLLGITNILVVINKIDKVEYQKDVCKSIEEKIRVFLDRLNIKPLFVIPISSKNGDNIVEVSKNTPWYTGCDVLSALDCISEQKVKNTLRFPIQDIYKWDDKRIITGRIESGELCVGDKIVFSPSLKEVTVKTIEKWNEQPQKATEGECIGITTNEQIFIERGEVASMRGEAPFSTNEF